MAPKQDGNSNVQGCRVTQAGFVAALAADLKFGKYDSPLTVQACQTEWVIVASWGENGDFLSLSLTNVKATASGAAPHGLQPTVTHLGILLARTGDDSMGESEYLLVRHRPPDIAVGGIFYPSDGYARVQRRNGDIRITAHGRYAHCHGLSQGQSVVHDVPDPAPGYDKARAWHLTAERRPWVGDFTASANRASYDALDSHAG
jgi:hypothetical protein